MRIWLKYLIGIIIGLISAVIAPPTNAQSFSTLDFLVELVVRFGRYILVPVLFFSIATSFYKLRDEKRLFKASAWTLGTIACSSLFLMILGISTALIFELPPIPITTEKVDAVSPFTARTLLTKVFPYSGFEVLTEGAYLLPCFILAALVGAAAVSDKNASKPTVQLLESLCKVFYTILSLFTELLAIGMIAIMSRWTLTFSAILKNDVYSSLISMLTILFALIAFVFYPLFLYLICHELHPYKVLYASICSILVAFVSGDTNLTLALNLRHGKESLGIRKRINAISFPLFAIFGRGGSAMIQSISFILILRSYSRLGISVADTIWISMISFALSLVLGELPTGGPFAAITTMCLLYGRGFESGYLLLKNVAPVICAYAAAIDALTAMFGSYVIGIKTKNVTHQEISRYI